MQLYYSTETNGDTCLLSGQEALHCTKVLRHTAGDIIDVTDGKGNLLKCEILPQGVAASAPKERGGKRERRQKGDSEALLCRIISTTPGFGGHPYHLTMAVAPTKNIDRYEWFIEKATEIGIDKIVPVIGTCSERKSLNPERLEKILLSAAKQSLKGRLPELADATPLSDYISSCGDSDALKLMAYCGEEEKLSIPNAVMRYKSQLDPDKEPEIIILIGPEGDFTPNEVALARKNGFKPVHLGESRLRTETAAVLSTTAVYLTLGSAR